MGTLTSAPVKDVYQKLVWYNTSTNSLMYTNASDIDAQVTDAKIAGDLTITGNDIKSSSATAITLSSDNVAVAGDLTVTGNDIKSSSATALTLSGSDVTVVGDLTVTGGKLTFGNSELIHNEGDNIVIVQTGTLKVDASTQDHGNAVLQVVADGSADSSVALYDGAAIKWSMGQDANDSATLKFDYGNALVGGATKFAVDSSGNVVIDGTVKIGSVTEVSSDTDKFLMSDNGNVKYATGANVLSYIGAQAAGAYLLDTTDTFTGTLTVDRDNTGTTSTILAGLNIDYDHTGITASGQTVNNIGCNLTLASNVPSHVGTVINRGYYAYLTGGTSGTQTGTAFHGKVISHDTAYGLYLDVPDGQDDIRLVSSADDDNFFSISTGAEGATIIKTVDDDGASGHLTIATDGNTTFSGLSNTNKVIFQEASTDHTLSMYHHADDFIFEADDDVHMVFDAGDGKYTEFWYNGILRERILGSSYEHRFHYGANDYFAIQLHNDGQTDLVTSETGVGTNADLQLIADGDIVLDSVTGNITAKDAGGPYVPSSDYHIATKKYVDDSKHSFAVNINNLGARFSTVNYWYVSNQSFGTGITAADWATSKFNYACYNATTALALNSWKWIGEVSSAVDWEWELWDLTIPSDGTAAASTAAKVGSTQSVSGATANAIYSVGESGLDYSVAAGHQLYCLTRYTSGSGTKYSYGSLTLEMKI